VSSEPPADLVEAVAKAIGLADGYDLGGWQKHYGGHAHAALAVVQPEIDRLKAALVAYQRQFGDLSAAVGGLKKEREAARAALDGEEQEYQRIARQQATKILELTAPRVVDDALVEELSRKLFAAWGWQWASTAYAIERENTKSTVRIVLAALPPNLTQPVELTDEECDRLKRVWFDAQEPKTTWCFPSDVVHRLSVRAILVAAGRYAAPTTSGSSRYEELKEQVRDIPVTDADRQNWGEGNARVDRPEYDRLPYVGLTKEEAEELRERCLTAQFAGCIQLIAKALGAGGDR
jgi:hypothetical protein